MPLKVAAAPSTSGSHRLNREEGSGLGAPAWILAVVARVPLIVVSAWEMPNIYTWSPADVARWRHRYASSLDERLAPWCARYPSLEVVVRSLPEPAHLALLDASKIAQLTVVGRHSSPHLGGFRLGSTARSVLNAAERPVAVIPAPFEDPTILGEEAREGVRR